MVSWAHDDEPPQDRLTTEQGVPFAARAVDLRSRSRPRSDPDDRLPEDRDELDDRLADQRRQDLGWLVRPLEDDGYW